MTTNTKPAESATGIVLPQLWRCPSCGAATTDRGRALMGPLCWLCSGPLYHDSETDAYGVPIDENARCRACGSVVDGWPNGCPNGPHTLEEYEGGRL